MVNKAPIAVVWYKRDLRVTDHAALSAAVATGLPVVPLYVVEPNYWREPDTSARQYEFIHECLIELRDDLAAFGQPLIVRQGDVVTILARLNRTYQIAALFAHEETGNDWTFARDKAVIQWAQDAKILFHEFAQNGVIRRIKSRDGWAAQWDKTMARPQVAAPVLRPLAASGIEIDPGAIPTAQRLGLPEDFCPGRQRGGRKDALTQLGKFLTITGLPYRRAMSSPSEGAIHCSRLSPHLAYGTISVREVAQAASARMAELKYDPSPDAAQWRAAITSFSSRLYWRDHFTQKLEDQPSIEFQALHPAFRKHDNREADKATLRAWQTGTTGVPFMDACMRSLNQTGWLNFRMRAMVMSFASHLLDLPWRDTGLHLARQFTDYEPGIHWSQVQMQSGLTGINTVRIYNPVKQGLEHDKDGNFIRKWVPELREAPTAFLHDPWMEMGLIESKPADYPEAMIYVATAMREARERLHAPRKNLTFHAAADLIQAKHGSRKSGLKQTDKIAVARRKAATEKRAARAKPAETQDDLFGNVTSPPSSGRLI
jgi:deoxyribodipyrimidine photo-lyase